MDVVAASYGAYVGLLLAARHPERVASVVAATVTDVANEGAREAGRGSLRPCAPPRTAGTARPSTTRSSPSLTPPNGRRPTRTNSRRAAARSGSCRTGGSRGSRASGRAREGRPQAVLPKIACPVLVIAAGRDAAMPLERTEAVVDAIPGASLVVVPGSGHALAVEREDEFVLLAERFLARAHCAAEGRCERLPAGPRASPRGPPLVHAGTAYHWELHGTGGRETVCLFNGLAMSTKSWLSFLPELTGDRDVLLYDYLGQGASDDAELPGAPISVFGDALGAVLDELGIARIHAVGRFVRRLRRRRVRAPPPGARRARSRSRESS